MARFTLLLSALLLSSITAAPLVLPVSKDPATLQYITRVKQRTPLVPVNLTLDLGGGFLWVDCDRGYKSSTYRPAHCGSAPCTLAKSTLCGSCSSPPKPGCGVNTCGLFPENPIAPLSTSGDLGDDVLAIGSTVLPRFLFTCGSTILLKHLPKGVKGMAGFGRTKISIPAQLPAGRKFGICLTSSGSDGVIFIGDGPYNLQPNIDASQSLIYTPLLINPVSTAGVSSAGEKSSDYFIGVKSIKVNGKAVKIYKPLLSINKKTGIGGTKISTVTPYTTLEHSIYMAVVRAFIDQVSFVRVLPVSPFAVCYDSTKNVTSTRVGPAVPAIDLVLQSESVYWRMFGANTMVQVSETVMCLGLIDGGASPRTSIVIGGYQLEDNMLQFDLAKSRLGFSSSLLFRQTTCANFNFKTKP